MSTTTNETTNTQPEETIEQKVARLEGIIKANETRGWNALVQTEDGQKTVKELTEQNRAYLDEVAVQTERLKRENDIREAQMTAYVAPNNSIEFRPPYINEKPIFTNEEAAREFTGLNRWRSYTAQQRAQFRTITQSDVAKYDPKLHFGAGSSSLKATQLMQENPALYLLLKERAKKEGIA
jgi:hypothetical protein